jgi:Ca2+-binding RTX toxin-like protein
MGRLGNVNDFINSAALTIDTANQTTFSMVDDEGGGFSFSGTGLAYDLSGVIGGTLTSLRIFSAADDTLQTVTGFSIDAMEFSDLFDTGGIEAAAFRLFGDADLVIGSRVADDLFGYAGNDTIKGGQGNDYIGGSLGRDKLFGQAGADVFFFVAGDGRDTIMDFTDEGLRSDDRIAITQRMYNQMDVVETAAGVTLDFGRKGSINVLNWHAADVDISDFWIV